MLGKFIKFIKLNFYSYNQFLRDLDYDIDLSNIKQMRDYLEELKIQSDIILNQSRNAHRIIKEMKLENIDNVQVLVSLNEKVKYGDKIIDHTYFDRDTIIKFLEKLPDFLYNQINSTAFKIKYIRKKIEYLNSKN